MEVREGENYTCGVKKASPKEVTFVMSPRRGPGGGQEASSREKGKESLKRA